MILVVLYLIFGTVFAFVCAGMARSRNREPALWGVLGFFFGIISVLVLAVIGTAPNASAVGQIAVSGSAAQGSSLDELKKLKALLDDGVLNQEEFDAQKRRLLNTGTPSKGDGAVADNYLG